MAGTCATALTVTEETLTFLMDAKVHRRFSIQLI
jgi:hypothetical protein